MQGDRGEGPSVAKTTAGVGAAPTTGSNLSGEGRSEGTGDFKSGPKIEGKSGLLEENRAEKTAEGISLPRGEVGGQAEGAGSHGRTEGKAERGGQEKNKERSAGSTAVKGEASAKDGSVTKSASRSPSKATGDGKREADGGGIEKAVLAMSELSIMQKLLLPPAEVMCMDGTDSVEGDKLLKENVSKYIVLVLCRVNAMNQFC